MNQEQPGVLATWKTYIDSLAGESDRGVALAVAAAFEGETRSILQAVMVEGSGTNALLSGPLASFSARISACHALGLINDEERNSLTLIREIRNHFAHQWAQATFAAPEVEPRCRKLPVRRSPESLSARDHFISGAGGLLFYLIERSRHATRPQPGWWTRLGAQASGQAEPYTD